MFTLSGSWVILFYLPKKFVWWGKLQVLLSEQSCTLNSFTIAIGMADPRPYDLVVFGATGFTGQFVVDEVAKVAEEEGGLSWAVAGRNMEKLQTVLVQSSERTGMFVTFCFELSESFFFVYFILVWHRYVKCFLEKNCFGEISLIKWPAS